MDPISAAGTVLSLGTKIFSAIKQGKLNKENQQIIDNQGDELQSWYDKEKNSNFADSSIGKAILEKTLENIRQRRQQSTQAAVITGGTDEARLAAEAANQEQFTGVANNLAQMGQQRADAVQGQYMQQKDNLNQQKIALNMDKANQLSNLAGNADSVLGGLGANAAINAETAGSAAQSPLLNRVALKEMEAAGTEKALNDPLYKKSLEDNAFLKKIFAG